jgi:hypothetical protein
VFENRTLRRISAPKKQTDIGGWIKVHNEEFHNLYSSSNVIRMVKPRKMRWVRHVAPIGDVRMFTKFLWDNLKGRELLRDLGIDGWMILNWVPKK